MRYMKKHGFNDAAKAMEYLVVGVFKPDKHAGTWGSCPRCAEIVLRGRRHVFYKCSDNDCIDNQFFKLASKKILIRNFDDPEQECLWMRGILPRNMAKQLEGPSIIDARIWESPGFVKTINRSQIGYSDGTDGEANIAKWLRPEAF